MAFKYPTYEEWLADLPEVERKKALQLADRFRSNGCANPDGWVRSEISENFCQFATYLILSKLWRCEIDYPWSDEPETWIKEYSHALGKNPLPIFVDAAAALQRIQVAGIAAKDLGALARLIAYSTAFGVINLFDSGSDTQSAGETPGWSLRETDAQGNPTGRAIKGLHESLLSIHEDGVKAKDRA